MYISCSCIFVWGMIAVSFFPPYLYSPGCKYIPTSLHYNSPGCKYLHHTFIIYSPGCKYLVFTLWPLGFLSACPRGDLLSSSYNNYYKVPPPLSLSYHMKLYNGKEQADSQYSCDFLALLNAKTCASFKMNCYFVIINFVHH